MGEPVSVSVVERVSWSVTARVGELAGGVAMFRKTCCMVSCFDYTGKGYFASIALLLVLFQFPDCLDFGWRATPK